eukprot:1257363-Prymnesium_polylepis.1
MGAARGREWRGAAAGNGVRGERKRQRRRHGDRRTRRDSRRGGGAAACMVRRPRARASQGDRERRPYGRRPCGRRPCGRRPCGGWPARGGRDAAGQWRGCAVRALLRRRR